MQKCDFSICHIDECLISHFCHLFLGYTNKHRGCRRALLVRSGSVVLLLVFAQADSEVTLGVTCDHMSPELPFLSLLGFFGTRTALPWFVHVRCPLSGLELESERPDRHNTRSLVLSNKPAFIYYAALVRLTGGVGLTSRKHPRNQPKKQNKHEPTPISQWRRCHLLFHGGPRWSPGPRTSFYYARPS